MDLLLDSSFLSVQQAVQSFLTDEEANHISEQFSGDSWRPNRQVLWESVRHPLVEQWARDHDMQTLTIALGPLAEPGHPKCLRANMPKSRVSTFMKGAGALFTWFITLGSEVTIICQPPPDRFNPKHGTNFQANELPILRRAIENASLDVYMVHPDVKSAIEYRYQVWPKNNTQTWIDKYGNEAYNPQPWRKVANTPLLLSRPYFSIRLESDSDGVKFVMQQVSKL
ncbi:hypothetical protein BKA67DRAFT_583848 [Truncatella angustata]|uniref:Uncharacterized protein n=1 Tax=Truncatella angustata TaxID=152316 RepID=A0A9P8RHV6_9PEZI|nr:uncharacterized protein BKA67DRAFT_583848 [Truncatella angustata]KAH6646314.1 hypothetical protein BKA67DRAFT_583848 [Truncatella angustata]